MKMYGFCLLQTRRELALTDKYEIIQFQEKNPQITRKDIAERFSVAECTISRLTFNADKINDFLENNVRSDAKRMRKAMFNDVDSSLAAWFAQIHTNRPDFPISGSMLLTKANDFVKMYGIDGKINSSWIDRWKVRHAISLKPFHGEASSVNVAIAAQWMKFKVPAILNAFPPNVFNVDETALFWKCSQIIPCHIGKSR